MHFRLIGPLMLAVIASGQTITNFAGTGIPGYLGDTGPAALAEINRVVGLATDASGNIYMADELNNVVRKVNTSGIITTFAGTSVSGFTGDGGPATQAQLHGPLGVCVAPSGVIYVNDQGNHRVRAISPTGTITTVAGGSVALSFGDGGPATSAGMVIPIRCAVDQSGNLYITDQGAHVVRKVNTSGIISTFAGISNAPGFSGDGGPATQAQMNNPTADSIDAAGNLYVSDQLNHRIRKIDTNGIITTVAGNGVGTFAGDGGLATSASLNNPGETVVDSAGNLFIVDDVNQVIRKVTGGIISTVAGTPGVMGNTGDGGPPLQAKFSQPFAITLDSAGNLYVGDITNDRVRKISGVAAVPSPCTYTLSPGGQAFTAAGGTGSITIATGQGCAWSMSGAPIWVTSATSGSGNGTLTYQVVANAGADRTVTVTVAGISVTVEQEAASITGLNIIGSMPHIAAEENWTTTFTMVNGTSVSNQARFSLFGSNLDASGSGNPLQLPLNLPQQASLGVLLGASLDNTLSPNASWIVSTAGQGITPVQTGSAQVSATGALGGFAIFHRFSDSQEAVVPLTLATPNPASYLLAFDNTKIDNTNNIVTAVAIANVSPQAASIGYVIRDDTGAQIGAGTLASLAGEGQISFVLADPATGFPVTANKRGTVEFDTPAGGQISVLGIRNTPQVTAQGTVITLTTVPALANVGSGGGSFAFIASGDGWQTTFVLVNAGSSSAPATLKFFDPNGNPLSLPLSFPQTGVVNQTSSINPTLLAGSTLLVQSSGAATLLTGSAQLTTTGNISGFVIFRHNGQEAVVPIESRNASAYVLAFDNTGGTATGLAVNAVTSSTQPVNIPVVIRDDAGNQLATDSLPLAANGDFAGDLAQNSPTLGRILFPATANIRGTVEFDAPAGVHIGLIGIRTPPTPTPTYTSLPALAK